MRYYVTHGEGIGSAFEADSPEDAVELARKGKKLGKNQDATVRWNVRFHPGSKDSWWFASMCEVPAGAGAEAPKAAAKQPEPPKVEPKPQPEPPKVEAKPQPEPPKAEAKKPEPPKAEAKKPEPTKV